MKKALIILITLAAIAMQTTAAIGDWKIYMSYNEPQEIEAAGNYLFVRASNSLYLYNKNDQSIQTFDKTTRPSASSLYMTTQISTLWTSTAM